MKYPEIVVSGFGILCAIFLIFTGLYLILFQSNQEKASWISNTSMAYLVESRRPEIDHKTESDLLNKARHEALRAVEISPFDLSLWSRFSRIDMLINGPDVPAAFLAVEIVKSLNPAIKIRAGRMKMLGILFVIFGVCAFPVMLRITEFAFFKNNDQSRLKAVLPQALLSVMEQQEKTGKLLLALRVVRNRSFLLLFALTAFYAVFSLFISFSPAPLQSIVDVQILMRAFFENAGSSISINYASDFHVLIISLAKIIMTGFAFWLAHIYGQHEKTAGNVIYLSMFLFFASLVINILWAGIASNIWLPPEIIWNGYGWGSLDIISSVNVISSARFSAFSVRIFETGWITAGVLCAIWLITFAVFFKAALKAKSKSKKLYALTGLLILATMALGDFYIVKSENIISLWLSGWAVIGVLWASCCKPFGRSYRLHQT